ncbi:MAG: hypothetical protein VX793_09340 [Pseudomonadota bacterium]|nr:hypothetical protein [Pseudomonadota bacterium]
MTTLRTRALLICVLLTLPAFALAGDMRIHVLTRPDAAALLPVIAPLLAPGGTVRAYQGKLILRTTDSNMAELEGVLGNLEASPSPLIVHLRRQSTHREQRSGVDTRIQGQLPGSVSGDIRIEQTQRETRHQDHYRIRTLSGYPAHISQGTLLALGGGYDGTVFAALRQGIQVVPQLTPDGSVLLQISQRYDQPGGPGLAHTQSSGTTLRVQPGVWHSMGSMTVEQQQDQREIVGGRSSRQQVNLPLEVMVEISNQ